jgi:hypothetical protein
MVLVAIGTSGAANLVSMHIMIICEGLPYGSMRIPSCSLNHSACGCFSSCCFCACSRACYSPRACFCAWSCARSCACACLVPLFFSKRKEKLPGSYSVLAHPRCALLLSPSFTAANRTPQHTTNSNAQRSKCKCNRKAQAPQQEQA